MVKKEKVITSVFISRESLDLARALGVNMSRLLDEAIKRVAAGGKEEFDRWLEEKREQLRQEFKRLEKEKKEKLCPHCGTELKLVEYEEAGKVVARVLQCPNQNCPWRQEQRSPWEKTIERYTSASSSEWDLI
jgi:post-segregation antitoxin (ccd killing protein)